MTDNVIKFERPNPHYAKTEYGGCPHCGELDEMYNTTGESWFVCFEHKTKWPAGHDAFKSKDRETERDWRINEFKLAEFMEAEPMRPPPEPDGPEPDPNNPLRGCDEHGRPNDPNHPWRRDN